MSRKANCEEGTDRQTGSQPQPDSGPSSTACDCNLFPHTDTGLSLRRGVCFSGSPNVQHYFLTILFPRSVITAVTPPNHQQQRHEQHQQSHPITGMQALRTRGGKVFFNSPLIVAE